jgi:protein-disulfide isomerase
MSKREQIRERRKKQRQRQLMITVLAIIGAILIVAAIIIWQNTGLIGDIIIPDPGDHPMTDGTRMGDPNAPVVIEEFSDFLCPACQFFAENIEPDLIQEYVANGLVYFKYNNFALGPESFDPAEASLCAAEQGEFWTYHDILFANQAGRDARAFSAKRLEAYAEAAGLDVELFKSCTSDNRYLDQIQQIQNAAQVAGVNSTPTFFINGKMIVGVLSYPEFQQEINAAMAAAGGS